MDVEKTKVESLDIIVTMMAEHPPDRKASADFRRPAYPNYTVEDALKKWGVDTRKGVDAGGAETGRK